MDPIEFIISEDLFNVYLKCKSHPFFKNLAEQNGGIFLSRNENWECIYRIPIMSFLNIYKDLAEGFPVILDPFLEATIGESIKTPTHEFNLPLVQPIGFLPHIIPKPYQLEALSHSWKYKKSLVALPVGAGKSWCGKALKELADIPFTIICPASIKYQWRSEIKAMTGKDALVIDGDKKKRDKQYAQADDYEWVITNFEKVANEPDKLPKRKGVIIDEAHYLKNPDSKRTMQILEYIKDADYVLLLTGTFLVNSLLDGWALMNLIGKPYGKNFIAFKKFNCILDKYNTPIGFKPSIAKFKKDLRSITYYRQKEEIMKHLPERNDVFVDLKMSPEALRMYLAAEEGILADLDNPNLEEPMNPAAQFIRLRQLAADPRLVCPEAEDKKNFSIKIEWIDDFLQSFDERTVVIYSPFNQFLENIKKELPNYPWIHIHGGVPIKKREEWIEEARHSSEKKYFLITDALKTGKNIQFCQHFIFCTLPLTFADYDQLRGRIWREGQQYPTFIYHLQTLESIDHSNWELILSKKELMNEFKISGINAEDLKKAILFKKK